MSCLYKALGKITVTLYKLYDMIHINGFWAVFSNIENSYSVFHSCSEKNNIQSLDLAWKITPAKYKSGTTTTMSTRYTGENFILKDTELFFLFFPY